MGEARAIALLVLLDGLAIPGVVSAEVGRHAYLGAGRFTVSAAADLAGDLVGALTTSSVASVQVGIDDVWVTLVSGIIDRTCFDPIRRTVRFEGRDLAARFIDAPFQRTFQNQTSSEIVSAICTARGVAAAVTPTTTPVGRYFENEHSRTALNQFARVSTEWDLLTWLADLEGYELWFDAETLNFAPSVIGAVPVMMLTPADFVSLEIVASTRLVAGVNVVVKSWDCRAQSAVSQTAGIDGGDVDYVLVRPNLTAEAAAALASDTAQRMSAQAVRLIGEMPGELVLMPRMAIALADSATPYDGVFVVSEVERVVSAEHGYTQFVEARLQSWTGS